MQITPYRPVAVAWLLAQSQTMNSDAPAFWAAFTAGSGWPLEVTLQSAVETWQALADMSEKLTTSYSQTDWLLAMRIVEYPSLIAAMGAPVRSDFEHLLEIENQTIDENLDQRIRALSLLKDGWLDGDGSAIPPSSVDWLIENVPRLAFSVRPGLSPTAEGNVVAEWSNGSWEASAEIDLRSKTVFWHALNVLDGHEREESFQLDTVADWARLQELANEFSSQDV